MRRDVIATVKRQREEKKSDKHKKILKRKENEDEEA